MTVICINNDFIQEVPSGQSYEGLPIIPIGSKVTVIDEADYLEFHFYRFAEYVHPENKFRWWYDSRSFIPTSDIDETEMNRENIKSLHNA